jgi:hypothetical protein
MSYPTDSTGLSRSGQSLAAVGNASTVNPLHIEQYGGMVEGTFAKQSFMKSYVMVKPIRGTDTVTNDRIGEATLQKVTPGVRPGATVAQFDNVKIKVDTIVLARNNVALLDDFQAHYSVRSELGKEHGKTLGKFFDEAFIIQAIKSAFIIAAPDNQSIQAGETGLPEGWSGGTKVTLGTVGDEADPDLLQKAIEDVCQGIEEKDVDLDGGVILVGPAEYYTLLRNDRLINSQYSLGNGDFASGMVLKSCGLPLIKTNRIPKAAVTGNFLSNTGNGDAYDTDAEQGRTKVLVMLPKALLAGETIPLTSKIYYMDSELQWFIDSYLSFGVTPNRAEHAGVVVAAV